LPAFTVDVEKGRLRFFAKAIGQTDPVYTDEAAARAAGHPALPVPPTFLFCLEMDAPNPGAAARPAWASTSACCTASSASLPPHGVCRRPADLRAAHVADIYDKKGGALEFVVRETRVTNQRGEHVADLVATTVVRNG
jgi:hypothetical protein